MTTNNLSQWWEEDFGFFGDFYMNGDASLEGYLIQKKQTLHERTLAEVQGIRNLLNTDGGKLLDCPCGYGRHSIELAKQGFDVVGVDLNTDHLQTQISKFQFMPSIG